MVPTWQPGVFWTRHCRICTVPNSRLLVSSGSITRLRCFASSVSVVFVNSTSKKFSTYTYRVSIEFTDSKGTLLFFK